MEPRKNLLDHCRTYHCSIKELFSAITSSSNRADLGVLLPERLFASIGSKPVAHLFRQLGEADGPCQPTGRRRLLDRFFKISRIRFEQRSGYQGHTNLEIPRALLTDLPSRVHALHF